MREKSQHKGKRYLRSITKWLAKNSLLGHPLIMFGDAYDESRDGCMVSPKQFDSSLKMLKDSEAVALIYIEAKYRDPEGNGDSDGEFAKFLQDVIACIRNLKNEDIEKKYFIFISNVPPKSWRGFLKNPVQHLINVVSAMSIKSAEANKKPDSGTNAQTEDAPDPQKLALAAARIHVLVLSEELTKES